MGFLSVQGKKIRFGKGPKGDNGATFIPSVSPEGILTWQNDKDLDNPPSVDIKGPPGEISQNIWSTEERVVGTWVDGRPIYEKTITQDDAGGYDSSGNSINAVINTDGIDFFLHFELIQGGFGDTELVKNIRIPAMYTSNIIEFPLILGVATIDNNIVLLASSTTYNRFTLKLNTGIILKGKNIINDDFWLRVQYIKK